MLKIVLAPNNILSQPAKRVPKIDKEILNLIEEMKKALLAAKDPEGVGLAAPQIGKSLQLFIAKPTLKSPISVFINPVLQAQNSTELETQKKSEVSVVGPARNASQSEAGGRKVQRGLAQPTKLEGCLSLQNVWGMVKRKPQVELSYLDEKGIQHQKVFKGFMATIIQHEVDHLNGTLFPKRVLEQKGKLYKSHKNEKGEDEFEEIGL